MKYFSKFPQIEYPFSGKLVGSDKVSYIKTVDLQVRLKIIDEILKNPLSYYEYQWQDGDRPDIVAFKYYGDADLAWLVLLSAEAFDHIYDFPLDEETFNNYLEKKYGFNAIQLENMIHHYEDEDGYIIDQKTFNFLDATKRKEVTIYDYEFEQNELKRTVKLISREFMEQILEEFENKLKEIEENRKSSGSEQTL